MNKRYNNYHKHTKYSSALVPDTHIDMESYFKRAIELEHTNYYTVEHGYAGSIFEAVSLGKKYGINVFFGMEIYLVEDNLKKDKRGYHCVILARTDKARKKINKLNSKAHKDGFYYNARWSLKDILSLDKDDVFITTACVSGIIKDDEAINNLFKPILNKFQENLFLEIHNYKHPIQIEHNVKAHQLSQEFGVKLIHANDSHYIYTNQHQDRIGYLKGKGVSYDDEDSFILDYPTYDEIVERYLKQGVFDIKIIENAIQNTLIFDNLGEIEINKEIKMPSIYKNLDIKEKHNILKNIIRNNFEDIIKKDNISNEKIDIYKKGINEEFKTIVDTAEVKSVDYFLLNEKIINLAIDKYGGLLTKTGRGCFTKEALIQTENNLKTIDKIDIGDMVLTEDGTFNKVLNKFEYDIKEDLIEFEYQKQGSSKKKYINKCTLDHKVLTKEGWKQAKDLIVGDLLCYPKIKSKNIEITYDLAQYTNFNYDDKYVYELQKNSRGYKFSPKWLKRNGIVSSSFAKKIVDGYNPKTKKSIELLNRILNVTRFKTKLEYSKYCNDNGYIIKKIKRFIRLGDLENKFIGAMYADGWTLNNSGLGLAVNRTSKNIEKRDLLYNFAESLNLKSSVSINSSKTKNLNQLFINSSVLNAWFKKEFFKSKIGNEKVFNKSLLHQNKTSIKSLINGLDMCDGSYNEKTRKLCYDSTSLSIIGAYKIMNNILENEPMSLDVRFERVDSGGYSNKEAYKLRRVVDRIRNKIEEDDKYWYLPIEKVSIIKSEPSKVYDMTIENSHSYCINNIIVHNSNTAFYINRLLGFTEIDRFNVDLPLYPERFMSTTRLLETRSLPDNDYNTVSAKPFIDATKEVLGEDNCYYMIAYGTMQEGEAFRNTCRDKKIPFDEFNSVAKNLDDYRNDDYWGDIISESNKFIGSIVSKSPHPCACLLMSEPISEEIGLIRIKDEMVAVITSNEADDWKYLKNDYLQVSVWDIIYKVMNLTGVNLSLSELIDKVNNNEKVWDMYRLGLTATLNQADGDWATDLVKKYSPKSYREFAMWTSAIRPNFESFRDDFLNRKNYSHQVEIIDKMYELTDRWILFQENLMQFFSWLGVPADHTVGLIKKIAKKKISQDDFDRLEEDLKLNWIKNVGNDNMFNETWSKMQSMLEYGYNTPHALSVTFDSLFGAYFKSHYPLEYYTVVLNEYQSDKEKTSKISKELSYFDITTNPIKFGMSKSEYSFHRENMVIYKGMSSVKYINDKIPEELNELYKKNLTFPQLVMELKETSVNSRQLNVLIKVDYFKQYGSIGKLLTFVEYIEKLKNKTYKKSNIDSKLEYFIKDYSILNVGKNGIETYKDLDKDKIFEKIWNELEYEEISDIENIRNQIEYLGYLEEVPNNLSVAKVEMVSIKNRSCNLKSFRNNETRWFRFNKNEVTLPKKDDTIVIYETYKKEGWKGRIDYYVKRYEKI